MNSSFFLFFESMGHLIKGIGSQHIIMIQKANIAPRGTADGGVGISCNPFVGFKPDIADSVILPLPYGLFHTVLSSRIRKKEFPVRIALLLKGIQQFP